MDGTTLRFHGLKTGLWNSICIQILATLPIRVKLNLGPDRGNELNLNMVKLLLLLGKITLKRTPHTLKPKGMLFILSQRVLVIRLNQ